MNDTHLTPSFSNHSLTDFKLQTVKNRKAAVFYLSVLNAGIA